MKLSGWFKVINNLLRLSLLFYAFPVLLALSACDASEDGSAPDLEAFEKLTPSLAQAARQIRHQLDGELNPQLGSWPVDGISASSAPRLAHLQFRAFTYADAELAAFVQLGQASFLKLLDPVWGGVYQAADQLDSQRQVIPGKRLADQADALQTFAMAYQTSGEVRFRNGIEAVDDFLQESLASDAGTFYTSQSDQPENLPAHITPQRYWSLRTEHERRRFGLPPVEREIDIDENAAIISAYVQAFAATGESNYLRVAARAAESLLDTVPAADPLAQAGMGLALLDLYSATGEPGWLRAAQELALPLVSALRDGGSLATAGSVDSSAAQQQVAAKALTARLLYRLSVFARDPELAERALRLLASAVPDLASDPSADRLDTVEVGLTLELFAAGFVEIAVAGDPQDLSTRRLFAAALRLYHPGKQLHFQAPGRFPELDQAAAYICNADLCSLPIIEPEQISIALLDFVAPAQTAYP